MTTEKQNYDALNLCNEFNDECMCYVNCLTPDQRNLTMDRINWILDLYLELKEEQNDCRASE